MTIPTTIAASGPYFPNGATTVFPFGFKASSDHDVAVVLISSAGIEEIVSSASYAVTLAAADDPGGTVTMTAAPANDGRELWIYLDPTFLQEIKFEDEGAFNQTILNQLADEAGSRSIWLRERIGRAILTPRSGAAFEAAKGKFPTIDASGRLVWASGTGTDAGLRTDLAGDGAALIGFEGESLARHEDKSALALATRGKTRTRPMRILAGIDSLTIGTATSYVDIVLKSSGIKSAERALWMNLWLPGVSNQAGFTQFYDYANGANSLPFDTYPRKYSLDGYGFHAAAAAGATFRILPNAPGASGGNFLAWTTATIFYLKQPGGGTFDVRHYSAGSPGPSTAVNTDNATFALGSVTIPFVAGLPQGYIEVLNGTGKIVVLGILATPAATIAASAFTIKAAMPGSMVQSWAAMDAAMRSAWIDALQIDEVILCGGMNDRFTRTNAQMAADMNTLIAGYRGGAAPPDVTIVEACQPSDHATNNWDSFDFKAIADAGQYSFFSLREHLGGYARMAAAYGFSDVAAPFIHPSSTANMATGTLFAVARGAAALNEIAPILGASGGGSSPTATIYDYDYLLPEWRVNNDGAAIPTGVATMIMEFSITKANTEILLEFEVVGRVSGITQFRHKRLQVMLRSQATGGILQQIAATAVTEIQSTAAGGWAGFDLTITAAIVSGKLQVQVQPVGFSANIYARVAKCTVIQATAAGVSISMTNHL